MTLGERIAQKRKAAGLSQEALGNSLGVSRQAIYKWESDQSTPELEKLIQMSQTFGVSLGWLINEEEESRGEDKRENSQSAEEIKQMVINSEDSTAREIKKGNQTLLLILFAAIVVGFFVLGVRLNRIERKYETLQNALADYNYYTQNQINGIVASVQEALNQYSNLTVNQSVIAKKIDFSANTIRFELMSQPKKYTDGMRGVFHVLSGKQAVEIEGELASDKSFHAAVEVELTDEIAISVEFIDGDESLSEAMADYQGLYGNSFGELCVDPISYVVESTQNGDVLEETCELNWYRVDPFWVLEGDFKADPIEIREYAVSLYEDGKKLCDYRYLPEQTDVIDDSFIVLHFERPKGIVVNLDEHEYMECVTVTDQYGRTFTTTGPSEG